MFNRFSGSKSLEERCDEFWVWFQANSAHLLKMDAAELAESDLLSRALDKVQDGLTFEIESSSPTPRELVISADGIIKRFEAVEMLVDRAPRMPDWKFTRFRSRQQDYATASIEFNGLTIRAEEITCTFRASANHIHVEMFIPGCPAEPDEAFLGVGFLLIDSAIGEYDATIKLGQVEIMSPQRRGRGLKRVPFSMFRECFDTLFEKACCKSP